MAPYSHKPKETVAVPTQPQENEQTPAERARAEVLEFIEDRTMTLRGYDTINVNLDFDLAAAFEDIASLIDPESLDASALHDACEEYVYASSDDGSHLAAAEKIRVALSGRDPYNNGSLA